MKYSDAVFAAIGLAVVFGLAIWFTASVWSECRDYGHSVFYCVRMISR